MPGMPTLNETLFISFAYLLGSIPTAVLVCQAMGIADPRQQGSGNPGATNVLRIGNRLAALLTLSGDLSKGAAAVALARWATLAESTTALCALAAILGHLYPIQALRQGGKGVATTLGCSLILSWPLALCQLLSWLTVILLSRISSLASVITALMTPIYSYLLKPDILGTMSLISLLLLSRHSRNLRNLFRHNEPKL